jgi:integrase/recombinase XerD
MAESLFGKFGFKIETEEVQKEFLSEEEILKLYELLLHSNLSLRLKKTLYWFLFAMETSLRFTDVLEVSKVIAKGNEHFHIRGKSLYLIQGKGTVPNRIPLTDDAIMLLENPIGEPMKVNNNRVNDDLIEICNKVGIDRHITFHCSRHTFAVEGLRNDMNMKAISTVMGHKSVTITERYAKYADKSLDKEMEKRNSSSRLRRLLDDKEKLKAELEGLVKNYNGNDLELGERISELIDKL